MNPLLMLTAATAALSGLAGTALVATASQGPEPRVVTSEAEASYEDSLLGRRASWTYDVQRCSARPWSREQGVDRLPASARLVSLTSCRLSTRRVRGGRTWLVEETSHTTTGMTELAAALRRPDADGLPCPVTGPPFVVEDAAGIRYRPRLPRGGCGADQLALDAVGAAADRGNKSVRFVRPLDSEAEIRAYCPRSHPPPREYHDETGPHPYPKPACE